MRANILLWGLAIGVVAGMVAGGCRSGEGAGADQYFPSGGVSFRNETKVNERLHLPDSSVVIVAPGTTVGLAKGFGKTNRQVSLDGKAWFEVGGGPGQFEMRTRDMVTDVLTPGRFYAEAFQARPGEEIELLEGGLRVRKSYHSDTDNEPEVLVAGEMVMINRDIDLMEKEKLNAAELEKLKGGW